MTKISKYPEISIPTLDDLLIGTDVEHNDATKNFSNQSLLDLFIPYKIYNAILTQEEESNPSANVLQSNLDGVVVWNRVSTGVYTATLSNAFNPSKTLVQATNSTVNIASVSNTTSNFIEISMFNPQTLELVDGFTKMSVEIKVYN